MHTPFFTHHCTPAQMLTHAPVPTPVHVHTLMSIHLLICTPTVSHWHTCSRPQNHTCTCTCTHSHVITHIHTHNHTQPNHYTHAQVFTLPQGCTHMRALSNFHLRYGSRVTDTCQAGWARTSGGARTAPGLRQVLTEGAHRACTQSHCICSGNSHQTTHSPLTWPSPALSHCSGLLLPLCCPSLLQGAARGTWQAETVPRAGQDHTHTPLSCHNRTIICVSSRVPVVGANVPIHPGADTCGHLLPTRTPYQD